MGQGIFRALAIRELMHNRHLSPSPNRSRDTQYILVRESWLSMPGYQQYISPVAYEPILNVFMAALSSPPHSQNVRRHRRLPIAFHDGLRNPDYLV